MKNEISDKKAAAIRDFDKLSNNGEVGFYCSCQITMIFLLEKGSANAFNYFTLVTFDETEYLQEDAFLTKPPLSINANYQLGIWQARITTDSAKDLFHQIQAGRFDIYSKKCNISKKLILLPKQFVSSNWDFEGTPPVGKLLKPNYWGDSYIIEFFCEDKPLTGKLTQSDIDKINSQISKTSLISINLVGVYERTENIVFQFPITLIKCKYQLKQTDALDVSVYNHPKLSSPLSLLFTAKTSIDNLTTGYANQITCSYETPICLNLGDSNKLELLISKANSDILLHQSLSNFIRSFGGLMLAQTAHSEPRTITTRSGEIFKVSISHPTSMNIGGRKDDFIQQITRREHQNELLRNSGDCKVFDINMHKEAYEFVRGLIGKHKDRVFEICLWDPYLQAPNIIETLYFQNTGLPFRCITSLKTARKIGDDGEINESSNHSLSYAEFKNKELNYFKSKSNNLRVFLEYRCQHDIYGTSFHDRFLIFTPSNSNDLPIVYSLGTSINSLGKSHHMIQKVTDARLIQHNFNEMWNKLDPNYCQVVSFPKDLNE